MQLTISYKVDYNYLQHYRLAQSPNGVYAYSTDVEGALEDHPEPEAFFGASSSSFFSLEVDESDSGGRLSC